MNSRQINEILPEERTHEQSELAKQSHLIGYRH